MYTRKVGNEQKILSIHLMRANQTRPLDKLNGECSTTHNSDPALVIMMTRKGVSWHLTALYFPAT